MTIYAKSGTTIHIGRVGENLATDVVFDISTWVEEYGQGTAELVINQNGETYPQYTTREDNLIKWKVTNSNTSDAGMGKCELFYLVDEIKVKSAIYDFIVTNSLDYEEGAEPPAPFESWVEDVIESSVIIKEIYPIVLEAKESALNSKEQAEAWSSGTINGVVVDDTAPQHENNSKYWSEVSQDTYQETVKTKDAAVEAQGKAETAQTKAETAQSFSEEAQKKAEEAQSKAETAQNLSEQAQGKSESAQKAAEEAKTLAQKAQGLAETAQNKAEAAQNKSEQAQAAAETAKDLAEEAEIETKAARDETIEIRDNAILINSNPPYMSTETGNWVVWNKANQTYEDSGVRYSLSIARSYGSVAEMNADVGNMKDGDLVIIASDINEEDNSKLFVHDGTKWIYLSDLSGFQGVGIARIERTAGNGAAGTTDTYTVFLTDNRTYDFTVYNGADGTGAGDMMASVYDKNGDVLAAGGIDEYVKENTPTILLKSWTMENINN